jgi:hypothetical protein
VTIPDRKPRRDIGHVGPGKEMKYLIYKITNLINGKYYIGRHRTTNESDSYMGSGIGIKNAIAKYGLENFTKEIIAESWDETNLWELEKQIVNEDVVKDTMSYNNSYGGKHYLHGLKEYDYDAFIEHQRKAGQAYAKTFTKQSKEWHAKGGFKSSSMRSEQYIYSITTPAGKNFKVNGIEFKSLCNQQGWNYNTLHWKKSMGKVISRGAHKGFLVEQLSKYVSTKEQK